jgi:hypothetical protein
MGGVGVLKGHYKLVQLPELGWRMGAEGVLQACALSGLRARYTGKLCVGLGRVWWHGSVMLSLYIVHYEK